MKALNPHWDDGVKAMAQECKYGKCCPFPNSLIHIYTSLFSPGLLFFVPDTQFMSFLTFISQSLLLKFLSSRLLEIHFSLSLFCTLKANQRLSSSLISFLALASHSCLVAPALPYQASHLNNHHPYSQKMTLLLSSQEKKKKRQRRCSGAPSSSNIHMSIYYLTHFCDEVFHSPKLIL